MGRRVSGSEEPADARFERARESCECADEAQAPHECLLIHFVMSPEYERQRDSQRHYREKHAIALCAQKADYYAKNTEKVKKKVRLYRLANLDKVRERSRKWNENNKQLTQAYGIAWRKANPERAKEHYVAWKKANPDRARQHSLKWAAKHAPLYRAWAAARKAMLRHRLPAWANKDAIRAFYAEAERLTRTTGIRHSVDHILPLKGRKVSGLHVETNLRVITHHENCVKNNRYEITA